MHGRSRSGRRRQTCRPGPSRLSDGRGTGPTVGDVDAIILVLTVATADLHHVPSVRLTPRTGHARADRDAKLFLPWLPASVADGVDPARLTPMIFPPPRTQPRDDLGLCGEAD